MTIGPSAMILGETGTGKELAARPLHFGGTRAAQPFIALNCATLPDATIDAELFGIERGAAEERIGLFEAANGGMLFLDEVGALSPRPSGQASQDAGGWRDQAGRLSHGSPCGCAGDRRH